MRKVIIIPIILLLSSLCLYGQSGGNKLELGAGYAPFFLTSVDDGQTVPYKCNAYIEWRYVFGANKAGRAFDVGAKLDYKTFPTSTYDMTAVNYSGTQHDIALLVLADLNFNPGGKVNPFIGIGLGPGVLINNWKSSEVLHPEVLSPDYYIMPTGLYPEYVFIASPRVGIELFRHLRLSASVDCSLSDTRWPVCFSIGWSF